MKESSPEKRLGWPAKVAIMAGLSLAPKHGGVEARPTISQAERVHTQTREAAHIAEVRRHIEGQETSTPQEKYNERQQQEMLQTGREIGERAYSVIFAEDLANLRGEPSDLTSEPEELLQLAEQSINQEVDQVTKSGYSTEESEEYRERLAAIAKDTILLNLRREVLPQLQEISPERARTMIQVFSQWDVTNQILPSQLEEHEQSDGKILLHRRENMETSFPPIENEAILLQERAFGDLTLPTDEEPETLDPNPEQR